MNTREHVQKTLEKAYNRKPSLNKDGLEESISGVMRPRPSNPKLGAFVERMAREAAEQQAENEQALTEAHERRQAAEQLEQLKAQKQHEWLQAGGTLAEFKKQWPEMRRQHLMSKVSGA